MSKTESENNCTMRDMEIFNNIQKFIRRKINNVNDGFFGDDYKTQKSEVYDLVRRSVQTQESNSAIICGPPGCGKTAMINNILKELADDGIVNDQNASVIRLNGLLHTCDRLALKDITRQLHIVENDDSKTFSSFQENLCYLLEKLKTQKSKDVSKPCAIFILDEFHLFCEHKNQILLYNLFDIVQSAKDPVCVIGLTYYTDVMDLMEKRVLSRFSHRIIWMIQNVTLEKRLELFKEILTLNPEDLPHVDEIYKYVWNTKTNELIENEQVKESLQFQLNLDMSQRKFRNLFFKLFNTITFQFPLLTSENVKNIFAIKDSYVIILSKLSQLELALVIAIKHQTINYEREPFNFEMIYTQFLKFLKRNATSMITERSVVLKAFQRLQELEIIVPLKKTIGNTMGKVPLEYQLYNFNLTEDQVKEGVELNKQLTTELKQWAISNL